MNAKLQSAFGTCFLPLHLELVGVSHFCSCKSILGTLGDLIMASDIAADVTRCSGDGRFQQHCGLSILGCPCLCSGML